MTIFHKECVRHCKWKGSNLVMSRCRRVGLCWAAPFSSSIGPLSFDILLTENRKSKHSVFKITTDVSPQKQGFIIHQLFCFSSQLQHNGCMVFIHNLASAKEHRDQTEFRHNATQRNCMMYILFPDVPYVIWVGLWTKTNHNKFADRSTTSLNVWMCYT